jgi:hypothetical protein
MRGGKKIVVVLDSFVVVYVRRPEPGMSVRQRV